MFFLLFLFSLLFGGISAVEIQSVERTIDLSTQVSKQTFIFSLLNEETQPLTTFHFTLPTELGNHVSWIQAQDQNGNKLSIDAVPQISSDKRYVIFSVKLDSPVPSKSETTVAISLSATHIMKAFPTQITQGEHQFVVYTDNAYYFTPYVAKTQETRVRLGTNKIESHSTVSPTVVKGDTIRYGPYSNVSPLSEAELRVHFENDSPFVCITKLERELEISHWGNLAVEETYQIAHQGASFVGSFSRYDYQRHGSPSVLHSLIHKLPPHAIDIYYRDEIGNISTSTVSTFPDGSTRLEISPRYPLFGGWKSSFYLGYNLPLHEFLFTFDDSPSTYLLNATFAKSIGDIVIDELELRVIFPEGSKDIDAQTPFSIDSKSFRLHHTYLDTTGRPVLVLKKNNLVQEHDQYIQVTYSFSKTSMLQEPLLLIGAFFCFFLFVMAYVRLDLSISSNSKQN